MDLSYQQGFGNTFASEAIAGTLPLGQNAPQHPSLGLYTEQLSLSAFTVPRAANLHTWLYRQIPTVAAHTKQNAFDLPHFKSAYGNTEPLAPEPLRWELYPLDETQKHHWLQGLFTYVTAGNLHTHMGGAVHLYACSRSMENTHVLNVDGDTLILPETGALLIHTELGRLTVAPGELAVIPRGMIFQVHLLSPQARGYMVENYGQPWQLPELGLIGANGLANRRDFEIPCAWFDTDTHEHVLITKSQGYFWQKPLAKTPYNVVAWHGTAVPYRYDLTRFNTLGSVSFDHPDPSIFTVLTSPSTQMGVANLDLVLFPPRWLVAEHTFRPPYFHRNIMNEFMGLIKGQYDAKPEGFTSAGASLHNRFVAHGPDKVAYNRAVQQTLVPELLKDTLAFMVEGSLTWYPTTQALNLPQLQVDYIDCWRGFT